MIYCWVYVSHCRAFGAELNRQISEIVDASVPRNHSIGVTGALACSGKRFAQYVEGGEQEVLGLRDSILRDPRHTSITSIQVGPAVSLLFPNWSMLHVPSSRFLDHTLADIEFCKKRESEAGPEIIMAVFRGLASQAT